jgi:hypothetical protein
VNALTNEQSAASAQAQKLAAQAAELADCIVVDSPEMYQAAAGELQTISSQRKKIEDLRLSITRPIDEAKRRIMDLFRGPTEALERAENKIKRAMLDWRQAEDARIARERAEAEAAARAERERAETERRAAEARAEEARREAEAAAAKGDAEAADAAAQRAAAASEVAARAEVALELAEVAPVAQIDTAKTTAAGISGRESWQAEVIDLKALVIAAAKAAEAGDDSMLGYLQADTKALNGIARSLKRMARVPGVRFFAKTGIAVRSAAA